MESQERIEQDAEWRDAEVRAAADREQMDVMRESGWADLGGRYSLPRMASMT